MNPKAVRLALWVWILGICLLISLPLRAQVAGATLSGTIADAQGGVLPNARVVAKDVANGATVETIANAAGAYNLPNLRPDDYEVSASSMGFSTVMNKLTLTVGAKMELNFSLPVGQVSQVVTVTEAVPLVETSSSTISGNVAGNEVRELPLNGRDWASLATLEPSVVEARTHLDVTHVGGGGGRGFGDQLSISGSRPTQNSYRLDGALVNDYSNAGPGSVLGKNLGVDAIQEFTVLTSNYSAEYGFTSGGVINAITRSGTNSFHGSAFEFFRNDKLDAANFFVDLSGQPKNKLRQNQFGFTAGYKILKDRLFLFGAYEGVRKSAGLPVTGQTTISDSVRAGNITNLTGNNGAVVNVPTIDANIQKYLALFPHPLAGAAGCVPLAAGQFSSPGVVGGCNPNLGAYNFVGNQHASENFVTGRGDYRISDKDSIFATYLRDPSTFTSPLTFNNELQLFSSYRQAIVMEETHIFNPSWVNSFRVAVDRTLNLGGNSPTAVNPAAGDASLGQLPGFFSSAVTLGNGITGPPGGIGGGASIQDFWGQIFQVYDDAFHSVGNHSFKFGFAYLNYHVDGYTPLAGFNGAGSFNSTGVFQVNSSSAAVPTLAEGNTGTSTTAGTLCYVKPSSGGDSSTTGNNYDPSCGSLVNFLTNQPQTASRPFASQAPDIVNKHYLRDNIFSGYFQDDWKFRSNLSFNLGLRYEFATIPSEKYGEVAIVPSPTTIFPCGSPVITATNPCPSSAAVLAGVTQPAGDPTTVLRNTYWTHNPTKKNFEPRIGFAYQPFKDGKTVIRAGFGVFDSLPLPYELILNSTSSAPWRSTLAGLGSAVLPSPPSIQGCANSGAVAAGLCASSAAGEWPYVVPSLTTQHITQSAGRTFMYVDNNIKRNYVFQYNLNVQRQISPTLSVLVGYTGSRAFHNPFQADSVNTIIPVLIPNVGYVWNKAWSNTNNATLANLTTAAVPGFCPPGVTPCKAGDVINSRRYNPTTGGMFNTMYISKSYYDALQIKVSERMIHGFQIQGSYTYSKSIDQSSGSTAGDTFQLDPVSEPWYDLSLDKGLSDFDIRHNLTINSLYAVPTTKSLGAIGERALGGWQLGVIARVASGIPIPLVLGSDIAGEGTTTVNPPTLAPGCTAATIADPNYRQNLSYISGFYKSTGPACLTLTPLTAANAPYCDTSNSRKGSVFTGTLCPNIRGNLGRDALIGPGLWNVDLSVVKNNKLTETTSLQFRAEMFNILNHTNFAPTSATSMLSNVNGTTNATFGQITQTQGDNRIIQLALKFVW